MRAGNAGTVVPDPKLYFLLPKWEMPPHYYWDKLGPQIFLTGPEYCTLVGFLFHQGKLETLSVAATSPPKPPFFPFRQRHILLLLLATELGLVLAVLLLPLACFPSGGSSKKGAFRSVAWGLEHCPVL